MITEAVQCAAARALADEGPILPLVQKRTGLLSLPRRREISDACLANFDARRYVADQELRLERQSFLAAQRNVVAREYAGGMHRVRERGHDVLTLLVQARAHD